MMILGHIVNLKNLKSLIILLHQIIPFQLQSLPKLMQQELGVLIKQNQKVLDQAQRLFENEKLLTQEKRHRLLFQPPQTQSLRFHFLRDSRVGLADQLRVIREYLFFEEFQDVDIYDFPVLSEFEAEAFEDGEEDFEFFRTDFGYGA